MTKREFDRQTKWNYGARMAGDTKESYKWMRGHVSFNHIGEPRDRLAERAEHKARFPHIAIMSLASRFRAPACFRLLGRFPTLPLTREERAALSR